MNKAEFIEITSKIEKFYMKEYNQEQSRQIYKEFKNETKERYSQIQQEVIKTCKFMPTLADFIEAKNRVFIQRKSKEKLKEKCKLCDGTGMIPYKKYDPNLGYEYQYVARCVCQNAEGISKLIPEAKEVGIIGNENHIPMID